MRARWFCLNAEMLLGIGFFWRYVGRELGGLDVP